MYDLSKIYKHGEDVYIAENVVIKRPHLMTIGSHVAIDSYFYCTTQVELGSYIHIAPLVSVIGGEKASFTMSDFCTIAAGCRIVCAGDEYLGEGLISPVIPDEFRDNIICKPVVMMPYSAFGTSVVVNPGVTLNEGAVVGANSYVSHDIPAWEIWAGSPAKFIRKRPSEKMLKYGEVLLNEL
jgi:acetyltransferase-like isoleucine patch superfamily enzyme